jgi:hypothetical protein
LNGENAFFAGCCVKFEPEAPVKNTDFDFRRVLFCLGNQADFSKESAKIDIQSIY